MFRNKRSAREIKKMLREETKKSIVEPSGETKIRLDSFEHIRNEEISARSFNSHSRHSLFLIGIDPNRYQREVEKAGMKRSRRDLSNAKLDDMICTSKSIAFVCLLSENISLSKRFALFERETSRATRIATIFPNSQRKVYSILFSNRKNKMAVDKKKAPVQQSKKAKKAISTQKIRSVQNAKKNLDNVAKRHRLSRSTVVRYRRAGTKGKLTPPEFRDKRDTCLRESI